MNKFSYEDKKIAKAQNSIVIIDDFISDKQLLNDIENDESFFPKDMGQESRQLKTGNAYHGSNAEIFSPCTFCYRSCRSPGNWDVRQGREC